MTTTSAAITTATEDEECRHTSGRLIEEGYDRSWSATFLADGSINAVDDQFSDDGSGRAYFMCDECGREIDVPMTTTVHWNGF